MHYVNFSEGNRGKGSKKGVEAGRKGRRVGESMAASSELMGSILWLKNLAKSSAEREGAWGGMGGLRRVLKEEKKQCGFLELL